MPHFVLELTITAVVFVSLATVVGLAIDILFLTLGAAVAAYATHIIAIGFLRTDDIDPLEARGSLLDHGYAARLSVTLFVLVIIAPSIVRWLE